MEFTNETLVVEFVLKGFSSNYTVHIIMFVGVLVAFLIILTANILIILIYSDYHLHFPMYFFLVKLSFMELIINCTILPKVLSTLISVKTTISIAGCYTQSFLYYFLSSTCFFLLGIMSFDRYVAICHPLRYSTIMNNAICAQLMAGCLVSSFLCILIPFILLLNMPFCGRVIDHFFCDSAALLKLSCTDSSIIKLYAIISSIVILIGSLTILVISYVFIVFTIIRIPSDKARIKTFSTCVSHLTMVSIVFGSAIFIKIIPHSKSSVETDKGINLLSTILAALLNPFVYTLRNQKVKDSIRESFRRNNILILIKR